VNSNIKYPPKSGKKKNVPWNSVTTGLNELNANEEAMGRKKLRIEPACTHTHFTWGERVTLQYYYTGTNKYQKVRSPTLLGRILGKHERTIRRELQRGLVLHEVGDVPFERWDYNADYAQHDAERKSLGKGSDLRLGKDWVFEAHMSHLVRDRHYSPYAIIQHFQTTG